MVTGQDVEPDPDREGRWRIARRVAKDRTISTVDAEARHGHKTRTRKRDGYKAHVATEPETGLVTAAVLTAANTPDADSIKDLVAEEPPGAEIVADSAYASGAALETFDDLGHAPVVPPRSRSGATAAPCGHDAPPPSVDGLSKSTNTTTVGRRTKHGGPKKKPATPTGTCGRPWNGPSPGSPAAEPDVFPTEESSPTSNGSPPEPQPSTYDASSTSDSPTQPPAGCSTPPRTPKPGRHPQRTRPPNPQIPVPTDPTTPKHAPQQANTPTPTPQ